MTLTVPFKVKVGKHGHSLRITIPTPIKEYLNIQEGDVVELTVIDHTINVRKREL